MANSSFFKNGTEVGVVGIPSSFYDNNTTIDIDSTIRVFRYGAGPPSDTLGITGDFYIDTSANFLYGPKLSIGWPPGTSLVGPRGSTSGVVLFSINGGGATITTGVQSDLDVYFPFDCTITEWVVLSNEVGSVSIDILKDSYSNYPPTGGDSITGGNNPSLSNSIKNKSTSLTGWNTAVSAGDTLRVNVVSVSGCKRISLFLTINKP